MSNEDSDHLFTLIRSLGKAEKRHFKMYSGKHVIGGGNIYVRLFDEIEKQKTYNEQALKSQKVFHDFSSLRKRLYKSILRSLEVYHSSIGIDVRSLLNQVEILFDKSLFGHCMRQVRKAKKIAEKYELYEEWLQLLKWEYRVAVKKFDMPLRMQALEEEVNVLKLLGNYKTFRDLANRFSLMYQQYGTERSSKDLQEMKKLLRKPILRYESNALSIRAKQNFYDCHYFYELAREDYKNTYRISKKMVDLYHADADLIAFNASSYLTAINNFLVACNGLKKYGEMKIYIQKLEESRRNMKSRSERATAFFFLYHLLNYYISTGLFKEGLDDLKRIEQELNEYEGSLNQLQKVILHASIAQMHFGLVNYKQCLSWLNKIISSGEMHVRTDIECFVRLFYLIVNYEAGSDRDRMFSLMKSTYRFLYLRNRLYKFESTWLDFLRKYALQGTWNQDMKNPFADLKRKLELLAKDKYERHALGYFDFISWLESKIGKKSFAQVILLQNRHRS